MKKIIILGIVIILFCFSLSSGFERRGISLGCLEHSDCAEDAACSTEGQCVECVETDDGRDAFVKGILSGVSVEGIEFEESEDTCSGPNTLVEYYCNTLNGNTFAYENRGYSCGASCEEGRCIECSIDTDCESGNCNEGRCGVRMLSAELPRECTEHSDCALSW